MATIYEKCAALADQMAKSRPEPAELVHVNLPPGCHTYKSPPLCFILDGVLTQSECESFVALGEENGFKEALVNIGGGREVSMSDVRQSERTYLDSPELAQEVWQRIKHSLPTTIPRNPEWTAVGLNERLRILKYGPGGNFQPHLDGAFQRGHEAGDRKGELSFVTVQIYLNEGMEGGATTFIGSGDCEVEVRPKPGRVLVFEHRMLHEGSEVTSGLKYAIRTDVMYTNKGPGQEYSCRPIVLSGGRLSELNLYQPKC